MSYDDMIYMKHPDSKKHKRMPMDERAAQFSPFAALTGYDEAIDEEARFTDEKPDLSDERKEEISQFLSYLKEKPGTDVILFYFIPDEKKKGGSFKRLHVRVKRIEETEGYLLTEDKTRISFNDILNIQVPEMHENED